MPGPKPARDEDNKDSRPVSKHRILFVCTGNICRSPTAEGVLRHKAQETGLDHLVEVDSAGTHGYHVGDPPDPRAIRQAAERGYDLSDLRARKVRRDDFHDFDLILGMDRGHMSLLSRMAPAEARAELRLFLDGAPDAGHGRDVPDPYYGDLSDYDHALDLIEHGVEALIRSLRHNA